MNKAYLWLENDRIHLSKPLKSSKIDSFFNVILYQIIQIIEDKANVVYRILMHNYWKQGLYSCIFSLSNPPEIVKFTRNLRNLQFDLFVEKTVNHIKSLLFDTRPLKSLRTRSLQL